MKLEKKLEKIKDFLKRLNDKKWRSQENIEKNITALIGPSMIVIRPMFQWFNSCVRAHVFSCILSLLLLSLLRKELDQKSVELSYNQILNELNEIKIKMINVGSTSKPFYKLNRHLHLADKIYKILNLKSFL